MELFDNLKSGTKKPSIDLTDYKFVSDNHVRTQNGQKSNANNKGAWRGIRIQSSDNLIFTVSMYNLTGIHPVWGDNIQMAPKQMRLIEENEEKIFLRGFGTDAMGASFDDYGTTLHKQNGSIEKVTLHMFDRDVEITYLKGNPTEDYFKSKTNTNISWSVADRITDMLIKENQVEITEQQATEEQQTNEQAQTTEDEQLKEVSEEELLEETIDSYTIQEETEAFTKAKKAVEIPMMEGFAKFVKNAMTGKDGIPRETMKRLFADLEKLYKSLRNDNPSIYDSTDEEIENTRKMLNSSMTKTNEFSTTKETPKSEQNFDSIFAFTKNFKQKWDSGEINPIAQMMLASQTDNLNSKGAECYNNGDTDGALNYFSQALQIMPTNDNALFNLAKSYTRKGDYTEAINPLRMLYYLCPTSINKSKSIAYSLLLHLIKNFGSDGGEVTPTVLIDYMKNKFQFTTNDDEIKEVIWRINEPYNRDIILCLLGSYGGLLTMEWSSKSKLYMTSGGTALSTIEEEIRDVLNWN